MSCRDGWEDIERGHLHLSDIERCCIRKRVPQIRHGHSSTWGSTLSKSNDEAEAKDIIKMGCKNGNRFWQGGLNIKIYQTVVRHYEVETWVPRRKNEKGFIQMERCKQLGLRNISVKVREVRLSWLKRVLCSEEGHIVTRVMEMKAEE